MSRGDREGKQGKNMMPEKTKMMPKKTKENNVARKKANVEM